jgi:uncharacterized protein YggU (UPF0235/DUF167 family)
VRVAIRLKARAKADGMVAIAASAGGGQVAKPGVTVLTKTWRVTQRNLAIVASAASRHKTTRTSGEPQPLLDRLGALIATLPGL